MVYQYYIKIIDVFMYGEEKEQKGHKEKKESTEFGKSLFFWHFMWAKTIGTAQALQK